MTERRYYWLKLKDDFFDDKHIRYLRKMPDGDRLVIVCLRMQLFSLKTEGIIKYSTLMPSCAEELALAIDEDIEIVKFALAALQKIGLVEIWDDQTVYMAAMQECIGSEGSSTERVRRHRERKALQSNGKALPNVSEPLLCHGEKRDKSTENKEIKDALSKSTDGKPPKSAIPYQDIVDLFNRICADLPKVAKLSDGRKKTIKARFNDGYTLSDFETLFTMAQASPFLTGKIKDFRANFDWLTTPTYMPKVLEGTYNNITAVNGNFGANGTPHPDGGIWLNGKQVVGV